MVVFIVRRLVQAIFVMLIISLVGFSIKDQIGDPVRDLVGERVTPAERAEIAEQMGLNDPFFIQYFRFVKNAVTKGDLGRSFLYNKPNLEVILGHAPATIELVFGTALIIIVVSLPLGVYCALRPKSILSRFTMSFSTLGVSMPVFLTAILLIFLFAIQWQILPSYGRGETVDLFGLGWWETGMLTIDGLMHLILPCVSLSTLMLPLFIRLIRSEMMEVLETEYIKYAWAKGLSPARVWMVHAFKNTLLPVITVFGVQIGIMFAFTLLTELVFQWPGMGFMFLEAVHRADISLLIAYLVVVATIFTFVNTIVDILYGFINPTVRIAGTK
ncbi:ABC transporter permease [Desulfosarcina alkanivorans]|uniref:ABC transporter permease n=1 Tax=Desulfosarcina alkanivorans TaxID=571177 RepID=A0A5K7YQW5_9BACT|nr:ABC transporter permease [Desulfosarcina alkanivorans]BBO70715.1 ABC transporter permease [Desulfosarcina alkanivorans]